MKKKLKILFAAILILATLFGAACTGPAHSGQQQTPGSEDDPTRVSSVKLDHSVIRLVLGETKTLTATVLPDTAADKSVRWESSDPAVLTVNDGELTAVSEGNAEVTVTTNDGGYTAVCSVLVADGVISVTGVALNVSSYTLDPGQTFQLTASVVPRNATNQNVTFRSTDPAIASVDKTGLITAGESGIAFIIASAEDGGRSASCRVTVTEGPVAVTGLYVDNTPLSIMQGATAEIKAEIKPQNASNQTLIWTTSDPEVASVTNGRVKGLKAGTAVITVRTDDGGFSESVSVRVNSSNAPVETVLLDKTAAQLRLGGTQQLKATVIPDFAKDKSVTWTSSAPGIVSVSANGLLTGVALGTAQITVKTSDGGKTAVCTVTVVENDDPIDKIDRSASTAIANLEGYDGGLRVKTSGELLFSPNLDELRRAVARNGSLNDYLAYIRFTYLPETDDEPEYVFHSICLEPQTSKGEWVDFFLQGDEIDCGFCPVADENYRIEVVIVRKTDKEKAVFHGTYEMRASSDFRDSPYYRPTPAGTQTIREEGEYYIRYTAASTNGYIEGNAKQLLRAGESSTAVTAVPREGYQFVMWSDGLQTATRSGDTADGDTKYTAYFTVLSSTGGIANMYLFTDSGRPVTSKTYQGATMIIQNASDEKYDITASLQIRGRGNSSWNGGANQRSYDSKNSYRIKLDEKVKLLGIGDSKNRDWILQSNKFDLSQLRNWMVWDFAEKMGTIPYVTECSWVQLYVNNEYRGMYMVCEQIEAAKDRVEIEDSVAGDDKGFLIELDFRGHSDDKPYFYVSGYDREVEFCIKSELAAPEDITVIQNFVQKCSDAINSGDRARIDEIVDIPSLIDMYILEELGKDCDEGRASFFIQHSPGGKLYFTAPWDFDFCFGTYGPATSTYGLTNVCPWYVQLVEHDWFRAEVARRMEELQPTLEEVLNDVRAKGKELESDVDKSAYFWNQYGRSYHQYVSGQVSSSLYSYQEHIDFLVDWVEYRYQILLELMYVEGH